MSDPFIGQIQPFGFGFTPRDWAMCNGQLFPISSNTALFSLLGTIYGGDGRTTSALPDLRDKVMIHQGRGAGLLERRIGSRGGIETVTLTEAQLPSHSHTSSFKASNSPGTSAVPATRKNVLSGATSGNIYGSDSNSTVDLNSGSDNTGGSQSHENVQPFLTVNLCIALVGTYPSRS